MDSLEVFRLAGLLVETAQKAGRAIMDVYRQDFAVELKSDQSPVTKADKQAEDIILADLQKLLPGIPVVAEEAASDGEIPEIGECFFLVDPLDGTKEFISKNGEFTVNIGLIDKGVPIFGLIYAPSISLLYITLGPTRAVRFALGIDERFRGFNEQAITLPDCQPDESEEVRVIASRSHMNAQTRSYLADFKVSSLLNAGSSLKFCRLAEGSADLYPRFAPTMEWDTAAGHAILLAAGGIVLKPDGQPFLYGNCDRNYLNTSFVAYARSQDAQQFSGAGQ